MPPDEHSADIWPTTLGLTLRIAVIVVAAHVVGYVLIERFLGAQTLVLELLTETVTTAVVAGVWSWFLISRPLRRVADAEAKRQQLERRLQRGLEMAETESESHRIAEQALAEVVPGGTAELVLVDSSDSNLKQVLPHRGSEWASCGVVTPQSCPAIRRGQVQILSDVHALDTCPHLRESNAAESAVCAPVNGAGNALGVIYAPGRTSDVDVPGLEAAANQIGTRLGMLRIMSRAQMQAATDPLTGLLNRRSLEDKALALQNSGTEFAVAYGDLDLFKQVNDRYGHGTGDRALRLFSRLLNMRCRASDAVARYGGEEFVVLLPNSSGPDAQKVLELIQAELPDVIHRAGLPDFTVSFGVAHSTQAHGFAELVRLADECLLYAKRAGRNRIVVHPPPPAAKLAFPQALKSA